MSKLQRKLVRDLLASRWQFAAVTLVVVLGVALFGAAYMSYENLERSYDYTYERLRFADLWVRLQGAPADVIAQIRSIPGVEAVEGRIIAELPLSMPGMEGKRITGRIITLPADRHPSLNDVVVDQGAYFSPGTQGEVLLLESFTRYHDLGVGDEIYLVVDGEKRSFRVVGLVKSPEYIYVAKSRYEFLLPPNNFGVLFMPEEQAGQLLDMQATINEISLIVEDPAARPRVREAVEGVLKPYGVIEVVPRERQLSYEMLQMDLQGFSSLAVAFPILFLVVAGLTLYIVLTRMVNAQRPHIGVMRAVGYSRRQVLLHYLSFALVVGILGSLVGSVVGYWMSGGLTRMYASLGGIPFLETRLNWEVVVVGILLSLVFSAIAGVMPAWGAASMRPAEAMRPEAPATGRFSLVDRLLGARSERRSPIRLSSTWKIPLRNIFRKPRRTLYTVLGVALAVSVILLAASFLDTFAEMIPTQFGEIQAYDAKVVFAQPQSSAVVSEIEAWEGVRRAEPILEVPIRLNYAGRSASTLLVGLSPQSQLYNLYTPADSPLEAREDGVLLGSGFQGMLGLETGDTVTLEPMFLPGASLEFEVVGFVKQLVGSTVFLSLDKAQAMAGLPLITGVMVSVEQGELEQVNAELYQLPSAAIVEVTAETKRNMEELMARFMTAFVGVMLAFGIALAFAIIFNTITVNILERRREIATMRTMGLGQGKIAAMVTAENLLTGLLGVIIGVLLGYLLGLSFASMFQTEMFTFELVTLRRTYILTVGGILLVLLLSELPSLRYLARLDLAQVTKERAT